MSAAAGGSDEGGGGDRKSKIPPPPPQFDVGDSKNVARKKIKIPVAHKPISKRRPLVPFTYGGKMTGGDLVLRGTLETQYSRRESGCSPAAPPPAPTPSQQSSTPTDDDDEASSKK